MPILSVTSFGGGVVLEGSADVQRTDEVQVADGYDIGPRGQLVATSDISNYVDAKTSGAGTALSPTYGLAVLAAPQAPRLVIVGDAGGNTYISFLDVLGGSSIGGAARGSAYAGGYAVTFASFPYVDTSGTQLRLMLICIGARPAWDPRTAIGLCYVVYNPAGPSYGSGLISHYDALGTGPGGEFAGGTHAVQLFPRGVIGYNGFAFLWGFDNNDATSGDGPNRLMFSNLGNPLKYGNDPEDPGPYTDHAFADSDAILIGGSGEIIRAGLVWAEKLWIGTSDGLHFVAGFGRESFLTNGAVPIAGSKNVIGPHAMIEGPDRLLHGVGDEGHWIFNGAESSAVGNKLRRYDSKSNGYWDLIWTDPSRTLLAYPGQSNADLVWMLSDVELRQVWIVIPYCSASNGYGPGSDTVIVKYHVDTGGYTRQVFAGKTLLHGTVFKRDQIATSGRFLCTPGSSTNVSRYRYKASGSSSPAMTSTLPDTTLGEYAPHGPDGIGVSRILYLTLSWESSSSLPLIFSVTPFVDQEAAGSAITLTIGASQPGSPADGDYWFDTSGTDTNLGNGTAGTIIPAHAGDYLLKQWKASWAKWRYTSDGGEQGTRASIPIAFTPTRGTRTKYRVQCTSAAGRFQVEGLGLAPATIRADK